MYAIYKVVVVVVIVIVIHLTIYSIYCYVLVPSSHDTQLNAL